MTILLPSSQVKPYTYNSLNDIFANIDFSALGENKVTIKKDVLAISCHLWQNFKNDDSRRYMDFIVAAKTLNITEQDYDHAETVADYFSRQILIKQLKGELSDFQKSVLSFIQSDRLTFSKPGLIYRLPEYYDTDQKILQMKDQYLLDHKFIDINGKDSVRNLRPLIKVHRHTQERKVDQYWLMDIETNNPAMLEVDSKNQIKHIWDNMFYTMSTLKIDGTWKRKSHSLNFNYMSNDHWAVKFTTD